LRYKVGDKVKIRDDLKENSWYSTNNGFETILAITSPSMVALAGKTVMIKRAREGRYFIEGNKHWWIDTMFAGKAERKFNGLLEQKEGKFDGI